MASARRRSLQRHRRSQWPVVAGPNLAEGKEAKLHLPQLDLDVDSDNTGTIDRSATEDRLEENGTTGKIIAVDNGDIDGDGIIDSSDPQIPGGAFTPIIVELSANCPAADPANILISFGPGNGLKLWKKDAGDLRDSGYVDDTENPGDVVPWGRWIRGGFDRPRTRRDEGTLRGGPWHHRSSLHFCHQRRREYHNDARRATVDATLPDGVYMLPVDITADIDTDSNNSGTITEADDPPANSAFEVTPPGKILLFNDDDDDENNVPDWQDTGPLDDPDDDLVEAKLTRRFPRGRTCRTTRRRSWRRRT